MAFSVTPADKKVLNAFTDKKPGESKSLSSDGKTLDGLWMGGKGIASWAGDKITFEDLGSKAAQTVQNAIRKIAPRNLIASGKLRFKDQGDGIYTTITDVAHASLLSSLVHLAHKNPELRKDLLPLIKSAAQSPSKAKDEASARKEAEGFASPASWDSEADKEQWIKDYIRLALGKGKKASAVQ